MADDLFNQESRTSAPAIGWTVTNHLNLLYMLGAGLVLPPAGFGRKYYQDTLGRSPGWIPLFLGSEVPAQALTCSTAEVAHLRPVILEIELTGLSGTVADVYDMHDAAASQARGTETCLWLPLPLPTTRIKRILFPSAIDKKATDADAADFGNVPLKSFKRDVMKTAFTHATGVPWPPTDGPAPRQVPLQAPFAAGAVAAMFLHLGNRGALSVHACHAAFDPDEATAIPDAPLRALPTWIRTGVVPAPVETLDDVRTTPQERLFWGVVARLVTWRDNPNSLSAEDALLSYLEAELEALHQSARAGAKKLLDTLVSLTGLGAGTTSELFARHHTPLARSMILFFLRDRCVDLLDFENDELHEVDWLAAAVLFGIRDGWLALPLALRESPGLAAAVSDRMARLSHRIAGTDINFAAPSPRVRPLREMFATSTDWSREQDGAAQELARAHRWDCATTRISLVPGTYHMVVDRGGAHIETDSEPKITRTIDQHRFFDFLAKSAIKPGVEARVRKRFFA